MGKIIIGINEIGWVREFNLADVEKISIKDSNIVVNNTTQKGICIKTSSKELIFGTIIKDKYKEYIYACLKDNLKRNPHLQSKSVVVDNDDKNTSFASKSVQRYPNKFTSDNKTAIKFVVFIFVVAMGVFMYLEFYHVKKPISQTVRPENTYESKLLDRQLFEPEMIQIMGGTFRMGDIQGVGSEQEKPVHNVITNEIYHNR